MPARPQDDTLGSEHQLHEEYRRLGVEVVFEPVSQPWGLREFAVREPNRRVLRFCAETTP